MRLINDRRKFFALEPPTEELAHLREELEDQFTMLSREFGAEIGPDYQYALDEHLDQVPLCVEAERVGGRRSTTCWLAIHAPEAWSESRGGGVTIAVVDIGIDGSRPEFPPVKRRGGWAPPGDDPWTDDEGHGTMVACIAAATRSDGGAFEGVAPEAGIASYRTRFYDTELTTIYDLLVDRVEEGDVVVATNSFGVRAGSPPPPRPDLDFPLALEDAIGAGVIVCFSAGNNHALAGGAAADCSPNSIWSDKCCEDLLAAASSRLDGTMWEYSSRGPGQHFGDPGMSRKPDVTAPTPANGRVLYGSEVRSLPDGWGTSGACPQVAGLAALLRSVRSQVQTLDVLETIRTTAVSLGHHPHCEGYGLIDCAGALGGA